MDWRTAIVTRFALLGLAIALYGLFLGIEEYEQTHAAPAAPGERARC